MSRPRLTPANTCACGAIVWCRVSPWAIAIVDAEDGSLLYDQAWSATKKGHVIDGRGGLLHHYILTPPTGRIVDHRNRNSSDCRRENLRPCTVPQNGYNSRKGFGASRFKGVSRAPKGRGWVARIRTAGGRLHLGTFPDEVAAALAYDASAREHHGEFALTNF